VIRCTVISSRWRQRSSVSNRDAPRVEAIVRAGPSGHDCGGDAGARGVAGLPVPGQQTRRSSWPSSPAVFRLELRERHNEVRLFSFGYGVDCAAARNRLGRHGSSEQSYMDIVPRGYDPQVAATAIRDGNYDCVTNSVVWAATDTAHMLPNSLYLTQKPDFFNAGSGLRDLGSCRLDCLKFSPWRQVQRIASRGAPRHWDAAYPTLSRRWVIGIGDACGVPPLPNQSRISVTNPTMDDHGKTENTVNP
jgi:hypothetical protein